MKSYNNSTPSLSFLIHKLSKAAKKYSGFTGMGFERLCQGLGISQLARLLVAVPAASSHTSCPPSYRFGLNRSSPSTPPTDSQPFANRQPVWGHAPPVRAGRHAIGHCGAVRVHYLPHRVAGGGRYPNPPPVGGRRGRHRFLTGSWTQPTRSGGAQTSRRQFRQRAFFSSFFSTGAHASHQTPLPLCAHSAVASPGLCRRTAAPRRTLSCSPTVFPSPSPPPSPGQSRLPATLSEVLRLLPPPPPFFLSPPPLPPWTPHSAF